VIANHPRHEGPTSSFRRELHTLVGAGAAEGAMDAGKMLKQALARGEMHGSGQPLLKSTDKGRGEADSGARKSLPAVWYVSLTVEETTRSCTCSRPLRGVHRVRISKRGDRPAAELSDRYIPRTLPADRDDRPIEPGSASPARTKTKDNETRSTRRRFRRPRT